MKKTKRILRLSALLLAVVILLCACGERSALYEINEENAWFSYPVDNAPVKAVNAGEKWYLLMGKYLGDSFTLAVGEDYASTESVYSTSGVGIWFFQANASVAAWCEETTEQMKFMVYNAASGKTEAVFTASTESGFQPANVGVWGESVYFAHIDYAAETAAVMRYDSAEGGLSRFCELEYRGEYSCTSLSVDGGTLLVSAGTAGEAELIKTDLSGGGQTRVPLEKDVYFTYACAYDSAEGGYAVYYRDVDGAEHIGTVNSKNGKIKNIFTFGENVYAYLDTVEFYGGHLYWVQQINASGNVADHYRFVDYNCGDDTVDEYLKTFAFSMAEEGVTLLSFNAVNYDAIYLTEIYLGGQ